MSTRVSVRAPIRASWNEEAKWECCAAGRSKDLLRAHQAILAEGGWIGMIAKMQLGVLLGEILRGNDTREPSSVLV